MTVQPVPMTSQSLQAHLDSDHAEPVPTGMSYELADKIHYRAHLRGQFRKLGRSHVHRSDDTPEVSS